MSYANLMFPNYYFYNDYSIRVRQVKEVSRSDKQLKR